MRKIKAGRRKINPEIKLSYAIGLRVTPSEKIHLLKIRKQWGQDNIPITKFIRGYLQKQGILSDNNK